MVGSLVAGGEEMAHKAKEDVGDESRGEVEYVDLK